MKRILCVCIVCLLLLPLISVGAQDDDNLFYVLGDTVEDFSLTTVDGDTVTLSGLLEQYKAVLLNFWFVDCGPSRYEFRFLQKAAELFGDDIAVLAVDPYDDESAIADFRDALGLSLMLACDTAGLTDRMVDYGFPTTALIDRNGALCFAECGAQTSTDAFVRLLTPYILPDYSEPLLLSSIPSVVVPEAPDSVTLNEALNVKGGSLNFFCLEEYWPWKVSEDGSYIVSANAGTDDSIAYVETLVETQPGDAISFRVRTSSEEGYDFFALMIDRRIVKTYSGENGWQTCAVAFDEPGRHTVSFTYSKNDMDAAGGDCAALDDVAILHGRDARRALSRNPSYPLALAGMETSLRFTGEGVREIVFDDPTGAVAAFYGAEAFYIIPDGDTDVYIQLGEDCDPSAAFIRSIEGDLHSLSHCEQDEAGFLYAAPQPNPDLGWNALMLFPALYDSYGYCTRVFLYFDSEESVNAFCRTQIPDLATGLPVEGVTWRYAE